jgi:hypothetical protein
MPNSPPIALRVTEQGLRKGDKQFPETPQINAETQLDLKTLVNKLFLSLWKN